MVVAALPDIIIAVVAVLVLLAFFPLLRPVVAALARLPLGVGSWVTVHGIDLIWGAYSDVSGWAAQAVGVLNTAIVAPAYWTWRHQDDVIMALTQVFYTFGVLVTYTIPRYFTIANNYAVGLYNQGIAFTLQAYNQAIAFTRQVYDVLLAFTNQVYATAIAYALSLYTQAIGYSQALYQAGLTYAQALYATAIAYALSLYTQAIGYSQALYQTGLTYAQALYATAIAYEQLLYRQAVGYAAEVGAVDQAYSQSLYRVLAAYIAAVAAGILAEVASIKNSRCMRFCNPLGDLGELLQLLQDAGMAALLLALAAELASDPQGAAEAIDGVAGAPVRALAADLGDEIGHAASAGAAFTRIGGPALRGG